MERREIISAQRNLLHNFFYFQSATSILGDVSEEDQKIIIEKHNLLRGAVQPPASNMLKMRWNEEAAKTAAEWVSKCLGEPSPKEERMVDGKVCGESILRANYPSSWTDVVDIFASHQPYFKYGIGTTDSSKDILSYTQIIWSHSNQLGCAHAYCLNNIHNFHYVCHYCPGGNIQGKINTPYKEGPSCGDCPNNCENNLCNYSCQYIDDDYCETLLKSFKCDVNFVQEKCPATCKCPKDAVQVQEIA
ncbi:Cysteine-rich venom protein triflin [Varanus komodoensis]|nr:Cysteine-rich venom protein triflin [Varanus komodoensis]